MIKSYLYSISLWVLATFVFAPQISVNAQQVVYEDLCHCAVNTDGVRQDYTIYSKEFKLNRPSNIPPNAILKKAFLSFTIFQVKKNYLENPAWEYPTIFFNNTSINLQNISSIAEMSTILSFDLTDDNLTLFGKYFVIDVTNLINMSATSQIVWPSQNNSNPPINYPTTEYFFLTTIYESPMLPLINVLLVNKNTSVNYLEKYNLSNKINPIDSSKKIALTINSSDICDDIPDTSHVFVNGQRCGELSDIEDGACDGVSGNMFFSGDTLIAYENDIANTTFSGADGVANIQPYLTNSTDLDIQFKYYSVGLNQGIARWYTNPIHQLVIAYTSTCEEFTVSTPEPQVVCKNEPLQLSVTGGNKYEWLPKKGLSCYDCPNPVVSTDSSRFYTVRVWNNDSCSVVRPVHVSVNDLPKFNGLALTPTKCADSTGKIVAVKHPTVSGTTLWSINGGAFQSGTPSTKTYDQLPEGSYTITLKGDNGCTRDTTVELTYTIMTQADFSVNPNQGVAPLTVDVSNSSKNFTNSAWYLQGNYEDSVLSQLTLDPSGLYTLQLITWYKDPKCADTSQRTILVYDTLVVSTPNVFTPNADGVNDFFGVTSNQPATVKCTLFNRWGNEVHQNEVTSSTAGYIPLWDGKNFDEGVYFFKISVQTDKMEAKEMNGFVHLEK